MEPEFGNHYDESQELKFYVWNADNCMPTFEYMRDNKIMNMKIYTERPEDDNYICFWFANLEESDREELLEHRGILTKVPGDYIYMEKHTEYRCLNFL